MTKNPFLLDMLELQQDGTEAISAPSRWGVRPPLLEVPTKLDSIVAELATSSLCRGGANLNAEWHFFVGSPGNGKSVATAQLVQKLRELGCKVLTEDKEDISNLDPGEIPYLIRVIENGNSHDSVWIAQDASVIRDPFSNIADPANELIELLKEAYERRVSLIVCTNRGVIEKAFRLVYRDPQITRLDWFKAMKSAVENGERQQFTFHENKKNKTGFVKFSSFHTKLDRQSLVLGSDTFEKLIVKATEEKNWGSCSSCASKERCPFYQNRIWLQNEAGQSAFIELLQKTEVMSEQIIVFREALALLSFILAGCPRDYKGAHPCEWVHTRVSKSDIFALASRRIYMCLYSSYAPYGLEQDLRNQERQRKAFFNLYSESNQSDHAFISLRQVIEYQSPPTPDVGAPRLLSEDGVFSKLDPLKDQLDQNFLDEYDGSLNGFISSNKFSSKIEKECLEFWEIYAEVLQNSSNLGVEEHRWLRRWMTAFSFRFGGFSLNKTAYESELSELVQLAKLRGGVLDATSLIQIRDVEKELKKMLSDQSTGVSISDFVALTGDWPREKLSPKVKANESDRISLSLEFPGGVQAYMEAEVYVWLRRFRKYHMSMTSFPMHYLQSARDALLRAAVRSDYATTKDRITLRINSPKVSESPTDAQVITIERINGMPIIEDGQ